jgi:hypothetical protein
MFVKQACSKSKADDPIFSDKTSLLKQPCVSDFLLGAGEHETLKIAPEKAKSQIY